MELVKYDSDQRQRFPKNLVRIRKRAGMDKKQARSKAGMVV